MLKSIETFLESLVFGGRWLLAPMYLGLVGGLVLSVGIVMLTGYGRRIRHFLAESQFEMRKVVWPSRDETVKTTIIILIVVVILALLLGAIDLLLKTIVLEWLLKLGK